MRKYFHIIAVIVLSSLSLKSGDCFAQKFSENEIKSAFVYNFVRFVNWPQEQKSITMGIVGESEFTGVLKSKLSSQQVGNLPLEIIECDETQDLSTYDVLIIVNDESVNFRSILKKIKGKSILSIGEHDGFCVNGGIINFVLANNGNYLFEINQSKAVQEKLQISSKLLKLAVNIQ